MDLIYIITAVVILIEVLLAIIVYVHNSKEQINRLFVFFISTVIVWTLSNLLVITLASVFWTKMAYASALVGLYALLRFVDYFPNGSSTLLKGYRRYGVDLATLALTILILLPTELVVKGVDASIPGVGVIYGPLFPIMSIFLLLFFGLALVLLVKKLYSSHGLERVQLQYISFGFVVSIVIGFVANLVLPTLTGNYASTEVGPYGFLVFLTLTGFAIVRYNLLNITVIATETFAALLVLILLAQVFLANTPLQIVGGSVVLVLSLILSYFLIRSMLREVRQKEQLEKLSHRLEEANTQLKHLDETKSEFVSIASHQLRTPLTVIKGYISMLNEGSFGKIPEKQQGPHDKVYESANRLIELVENLLSVSRIESGRMKYNLGPTQLSTMAASVVEEITPAATKKKLLLQYQAPTEKLPMLNVDSEKIRQVMMNLVDNAVKYTKKGTVNVTVRFERGGNGTRIEEPSLVFEVKDTGGGVRPEDQDRLFQKFIRGQGSSLVHTEGTGLGLYVGRMMVEAHGGHIWVESKGEDMGSVFAFSLPIKGSTISAALSPIST